jgi:adenosylcobyric acid synthase
MNAGCFCIWAIETTAAGGMVERKAACIAILGTGSDVGKSIVTTALCRILADRGQRVAPFKAQNMSNNSGVTPEGLEMGRAQIVQAEAARIAPHVEMNPVLLKPTSDVGAQVVLNGKAWLEASSKSYYEQKEVLWAECCRALDRLRARVDVIVMEGAGSCAEVNLMANDIVNLKAAAYAAAPVVLVADIDRGGVFAQIVGTLACLAPEPREQIKGFIINRFRGDIDLFKDGQAWIEQKTGRPVYGVLPWFHHFSIEAEDAVVIENARPYDPSRSDQPAVAVIRLPHISNFNDFDPLAGLDGLQLVYLKKLQPLAPFRAVILPGTKSTRSDLEWLQASGWAQALQTFVAQGGHLLGVCGGYQMLGERILDPLGLEGRAGASPGLGLLPVETELKAPKTTTRTAFAWDGHQGSGYEIHMGQTRLLKGGPLLRILSRNQQSCADGDGCMRADGRVMGTYIHGLFDTPRITQRWLEQIGAPGIAVHQVYGPAARDRAYTLLAEHAERHLDVEGILGLIREG